MNPNSAPEGQRQQFQNPNISTQPEAVSSPPVQGAPSESAPQQPYTITGPATERVNQTTSPANPTENPAPSPSASPEPTTQAPIPPSPDEAIASSLTGQGTEVPPASQPGIITNRTTEEGLAEGQPDPVSTESTTAEAPQIHEPKNKEELEALEAMGVQKAPLEDNSGSQMNSASSSPSPEPASNQTPEPVVAGADISNSEPQVTPSNEQVTEQQPKTESAEMEGISEMELQALFKDLDPKTRGNSIKAFKLFNAYKKLSGGDKDALKSSADALHDTLTDISLKAMESSEPKPAQPDNQPSS